MSLYIILQNWAINLLLRKTNEGGGDCVSYRLAPIYVIYASELDICPLSVTPLVPAHNAGHGRGGAQGRDFRRTVGSAERQCYGAQRREKSFP